jgi:hypothetical protein
MKHLWLSNGPVDFILNWLTLLEEPAVNILPDISKDKAKIYLFNKVIIDQDLFGPIRNYRALVVDELGKVLAPKMKIELSRYKDPLIGIHIRRG